MREFDFIIIGQGIAGTTLAWQLLSLGQRVAVIDRNEHSTASKVASGLISPITGKRNAVSWQFDKLWPIAKEFYEDVEQRTGDRFFDCRPALKLIGEKALIAKRFVGQRSALTEPLNPDREAIALTPAARLDVLNYLKASRTYFSRESSYFVADIDLDQDIELIEESRICIRALDLVAGKIVFCQGIAAQNNPWLEGVEFEPTKGEILTLEIPKLTEQRVVHSEVWLAPIADGLYLAGATYERDYEDDKPTQQGREEIIQKTKNFVSGTINVVDHQAAIRPTVRGRLPVVGLHPTIPQLGFFNGLGSKGALRAPFVAREFAGFLVNGDDLPGEILLWPRVGKSETPKRLTELAHQQVANALRDGDIAIDATAGNGFDTLFLAKHVGESGRVFAVDKQASAIKRTRCRLDSAGMRNTELIVGDHQQLADLIPADLHGRVAAVMFNLGYLPRGDKTITTHAGSTVAAIENGLAMLREGGTLTVLAYTGHPGGTEEAMAVEYFLATCSRQEFAIELPSIPLAAGPPRLYVVIKRNK